MRILANLNVAGTLDIDTVTNAAADTDRFLVQDANGVVRYRTGAEVASDIGAGNLAASTLKHIVKLGENISKGQAVYISSSDGTNMIVSKASNASEATSSKTLGLLETGGVTNDQVNVITEGLLAGLNTSTANAGDPVWLGTDGNLLFGLANKPYAPAHMVFIGIVTRVQQNNGEIFVKVQNGFELQELHNVQITSTPSDNDVLAYDSATGLYKMRSIGAICGYVPMFNPMTTFGDMIYGLASGVPARVAGNFTTTKKYLSQTGIGTDSGTPIWSEISGSEVIGAALTKTDDTNVTLTLGGAHATSLLRAASLTLGWTGQLSISRGGTGLSSLGTSGQLLRVNSGATGLEYWTPTYLTSAITSLNGLTASTQTFAVGTSGTDFAISSSTSTHTFNLPTASATNRGALSSADWTTFNSKQGAITLTTNGTSGAATLVGTTLNIPQYQTALTNPVTGTGTTNYVSKFTGASSLGDSQIYDNGSFVGINVASGSTRFAVNGNSLLQHTYTHSVGAFTSGFSAQAIVSTGASPSYTGGMFYGAYNTYYQNEFDSSVTIPNSVSFASQLSSSQFRFLNPNTTITFAQGAGGVRAIANQILQFSIANAQTNSVVSHVAGTIILAPYYAGANNPTITNYYGIAINNSAEYSGSITVTNRWGIYQVGAGDSNYFAGDTSIGTTTGGYKLNVNGTTNLNGALTGTSATFSGDVTINKTGASVLTLGQGNTTNDYGRINFYGKGTLQGVSLLYIPTYNTQSGSAVLSGELEFAHDGSSADNKSYFSLKVHNGTSLINPLTISSTGAATFSGTVNAGGAIKTSGQNLVNEASVLKFSQESSTVSQIAAYGATTGTAGTLNIIMKSSDASVNNVALSIASTGAATFTGPQDLATFASTNATNLYIAYKYNTSTVVGYIGNGNGMVTGGGAGNFGIRAESDLIFAAGGNAERMRISSVGQLKLNTYTSSSSWTGTAAAYLAVDSSGNVITTTGGGGTTLNGTGFVRMSGTTVSYITGTSSQFVKADGSLDSNGYITGNQTITLSGDATGSGTTSISVTVDRIDGVGFVNTGSNSGTAADTINSNGISYVSSNISLLGQTDGALYSQAYNSNWQHQIYGDYRTGQIVIRGKNSGTWQSWRTVLDTSNYTSTLDSVYIKGTTNPNNVGNFTLSIGNNGSYSYVQSHSSQPLELNPVGNAVRIAGNVVLHASNYNSYAPTLSGGGASGTWGINITGNSATVGSITPAQFFNNMGNNHSTYQDFNSVGNFGVRYLQGSTNGPGAGQYYGFTLGLGNDYAYGTYASQFYWQRNVSTPYIWIRYQEGGGYTGWNKISAGYADSTAISSQVTINYNNDSASTYQMLWGSGNSVYGTAGIYCNPNIDYMYATGSFYTNGWFRSTGQTGLYNETYGGGINMVDSTWVRTYGSKGFYSDVELRGQVVRSVTNVYTDQNYGYGLVGVYASTRYQGVFAMGDAYKLAADGTTTGSLYGIAWSHPNAGGVAANLNTHGMLIMENGAFLAAVSGSIKARDDMRAPYFYSSADTTKYFTRNTDSYTSWYVGGNQGNYSGFHFDGGIKLMMHTNGVSAPCGFYHLSKGWAGLFYTDAAQYLYHNASEKFRTDAGGIYVTGTVYATGDVIAYYSDIRLKKDIVKIESAMDKIKKLRGVTYTWNDNEVNVVKERAGSRDIGLIAQEVEEIEPLLITEYQTQLNTPSHDAKETANFVPIMSEKYKTIKYEKLVALLVEGMKEQQKQIEELKSQLNK